MINNDNILFCFRCYHTWKKRIKSRPTKYCPKCKSKYWNRPRKKQSKDVIWLLVRQIINTHDDIILLSGGLNGVRNDGGIYYAIDKILNYQIKHKDDVMGLGAIVLDLFAKQHYFFDGNKRTAYVVAKIFMIIHGCHLFYKYSDSVNFLLEIAKPDSKIGFNEIKMWLKERCQPIEEKDTKKYLKDVLYNLIVEVKENDKKPYRESN